MITNELYGNSAISLNSNLSLGFAACYRRDARTFNLYKTKQL